MFHVLWAMFCWALFTRVVKAAQSTLHPCESQAFVRKWGRSLESLHAHQTDKQKRKMEREIG